MSGTFNGQANHIGRVERDERGFILTGPDLVREDRRPGNWKMKRYLFLPETSVPKICAAGDVRYRAVRRVASAVGRGPGRSLLFIDIWRPSDV
jgi:thioredoxin reductase